MNAKAESNRRYYESHRDRIILRESELRPSTILELIDCLGDLDPHPADRRIGRLRQLYLDLTGHEAPQPHGDQS
jgi:hypothetical protein